MAKTGFTQQLMKTKNRLRAGLQQLVAIGFLLVLGSQCTQQPIDKKADGPCRLKQIDVKETVMGNSLMPNDNTDQTLYEYDGMGRVIKLSRRYEQRWKGQVTSVYSYVENTIYSYDADGFLVSRHSEALSTPINDAGTNTSQVVYTYKDGRLHQQVNNKTSDYGLQTKIVTTYAYDAAGLLTTRNEQTTYPVIPESLREKPAFPDGINAVWIYQNGKVIDFVEKKGGVEVHPYTFQNGLIQTQIRANSRTVYTYDNQGHWLKVEFWYDGGLDSYSEYTYAQAKLPPNQLPTDFKGFPIVTNHNSVAGVIDTFAHYAVDKGNFEKRLSLQAQHNLTGTGYVQASNEVFIGYQKDASLQYQLITTTTYTYDGSCE